MNKVFLFFMFLIGSTLFAEGVQRDPPKEVHQEKKIEKVPVWFTGPLIADTGQNNDPGEWILNPVVTVQNTYGKTNRSWKFKNRPDKLSIFNNLGLQGGLTRALDFKVQPTYQINRKKGRTASGWGDFQARLGLQVLQDDEGPNYPNIRITIYEVFPTGKYERLNAKKEGVDAFGNGAFQTSVNLIFAKVFHWMPCHPINMIANFMYTTQSKVSVHGHNTYGGNVRTKGRVTPGDSFLFDFAFELSLAKRCEFNMDTIVQYTQKTRFRGRNGLNADGTQASNTSPEAVEITLAPGFGYFFKENIYLIVGSQFSVASKNSSQYVSAIINFNYNF